jgi:uncharacterized membrane protein YjdF
VVLIWSGISHHSDVVHIAEMAGIWMMVHLCLAGVGQMAYSHVVVQPVAD